MPSSEHFVGRDDDGNRYYVEMQLSDVNERTCSGKTGVVIQKFTVSGYVIDRGRRQASGVGQIIRELLTVTKPAPGWTLDDITSLMFIWRNWHLNDMKAGCEHMPVRSGNYDDFKELLCMATGYKFGSAWLTQTIPNATVVEIERLMSLPTGKVPGTY